RRRRAPARSAPGFRSSGCGTSPTTPAASWCPSPSTSQNDFGSDTFAGEELEQDRVRLAAVDDVRLRGPALQRPERGFDLGEHAAVDDALPHESLGVLARERADELAVAVADALDVGQVDQLLGAERGGDLTGDQVGVDVVRLAGGADADRRDHRHAAALLQHPDRVDVDRLDLADEP